MNVPICVFAYTISLEFVIHLPHYLSLCSFQVGVFKRLLSGVLDFAACFELLSYEHCSFSPCGLTVMNWQQCFVVSYIYKVLYGARQRNYTISL